MYLFFDCETNGLPLHRDVPIEHQLDTYPHIIQLAWLLCDKDGKQVEEFNSLIKPDKWVVPKEKFWLEKGFSTEKCEEFGVPIEFALKKFVTMRKSHPYTIGHNIHFDAGLVRAECLRLKWNVEFKATKICTMQQLTTYAQIPKAKGNGYKWPKLEELHLKMFGEPMTGAHDALNDVKATAKCFFKALELNLIKL